MNRFRAATIGVLLLASLLGLSPGCDRAVSGDQRESDLRILFTGSVDGFLEPCGCVAGRFGGVDRLAAWVERERAQHPSTLFFDLGDLFVDTARESADIREQLPLKAGAMLEVWGGLAPEAMAVGCLDLELGVEPLAELASQHGIPLLCANLFHAETGERPFPATRIIERDGLRIGVFAVLGGRLEHQRIDGPETVVASNAAKRSGYELRSFLLEARSAVAELEGQVDLIVGLAHVGTERALRLAREVDGIDLLLTLHPDEDLARATMQPAGVPLSHLAVKGSRGGRIDLWIEDLETLHNPQKPWFNASDRNHLLLELEVVETSLANLTGKEPVLGSDEYLRRKIVNEDGLNRGLELLAGLESPPPVNRFSSVHVPMYPGIGRSEAALVQVDRYHEQLGELWGSPRAENPPPNDHFAGAASCAGCHPAQYEFWKATRHSRAYRSLEVTNQHLDAECAKCHTVGYRELGGWVAPPTALGFENVQCAACHGPGADHANGHPRNLFGEKFRYAPDACADCHNKQHDPKFQENREEKLLAVQCPPLPAPGEGSPQFIAYLEAQAERLEARVDPPWQRIAVSLQGAGDLAGALRASENWVASGGGTRSRLFHASLLIEVGRYEDAAMLLEKVVQQAKGDPLAWTLLAESLIEIRPGDAGIAALEAYSLDPSSPKNAELIARAALASGDRLGALDALRAHCERHPEAEPYLRALMNEISGLAPR